MNYIAGVATRESAEALLFFHLQIQTALSRPTLVLLFLLHNSSPVAKLALSNIPP